MAWFRRGRAQFRSHELAVLDAVRAELAPEAVLILDAQIAAVAMVQRLQDEREINSYSWRFRRPDKDTAPVFPAAGDEVRLATVKLGGPGGSGRAAVWLVRGRFFSIAFDKPLRSLGPPREIRVTGTELEVDPMGPSGRELSEQQLLEEMAPAVRRQYQAMRREATADALAPLPSNELYGIDIAGQRFVVVAVLEGDGVIAARSGDEIVARFLFGDDRPETYPDLMTAMEANRPAQELR